MLRELKILFSSGDFETLFYDKEKDGDSEKAMWRLDQILYEMQSGDLIKIECVS